MHDDVRAYNEGREGADRVTCERLAALIDRELPEAENRIWHAHPVWFLDGNPIVGYSVLKDGVRLLFWSGQSFDEEALTPQGKFEAAEVRYAAPDEIDEAVLARCLAKSRTIQWDYENIVKRKGRLERLR